MKDMTSDAIAYATTEIAGESAFALDLPVYASAELAGGKKITGIGDKLARKAVKNTLKNFKQKGGVKVKVESLIPAKKGLGESEAESVAVTLAVAGEIGNTRGRVCELKIDKYLSDQFFIVDSRVVGKQELLYLCSVKGLSFPRIAASFFGGFTVCKKKEILRRGEMEDLPAVINIPKSRCSQGDGKNPLLADVNELLFREALAGNLYQAMKLSAGFCAPDLAEKFLAAGAFAVSVNEGSVVGLFKDERKAVAGAEELKGKVVITRTANTPARVEKKPARIYKVREFLKLDGAREYGLL